MNWNSSLYVLYICANNEYAPQMPPMQINSSADIRGYIGMITSHCNQNVTPSTGISIFHIAGICSEQICLPNFACMSHSTNTVVYI